MRTLVAPLSTRRNPIAATLERARVAVVTPVKLPPPDDITETIAGFDRQLEHVNNKIREVSKLRGTLLGVERQERELLTGRITILQRKRDNIVAKKSRHIRENDAVLKKRKRLEEEALAEGERVSRYCNDYKRLDLTPLRWRNKKRLPLLAIFSLKDGIFSIGVRLVRRSYYDSWTGNTRRRTDRKEVCSPSLPESVRACFRDVLEDLLRRAVKSKKTVLLSAEFQGVIPLETKRKIAEAKNKFEQIFILAEVKDWKIEEKKPTVVRVKPKPEPVPIYQGDPLVVGWDGKEFWLIDSFDTTSLERYIEEIHCAKKDSKN